MYSRFCSSSLVGIPVGIASSAVDTEIFEITAIIKKYKSIIKKKKKKHDKIVLSEKTKLNITEVFISTAIVDSCICQDEFAFVNILLREYDDIKEKIQNIKTSTVNQRF